MGERSRKCKLGCRKTLSPTGGSADRRSLPKYIPWSMNGAYRNGVGGSSILREGAAVVKQPAFRNRFTPPPRPFGLNSSAKKPGGIPFLQGITKRLAGGCSAPKLTDGPPVDMIPR